MLFDPTGLLFVAGLFLAWRHAINHAMFSNSIGIASAQRTLGIMPHVRSIPVLV